MREKRFVAARKPGWERLEARVAQIDRHGVRALTVEEVDQLAFDYRALTSDLALAASRAYDPTVQAYLNRLAGRAHACVYLGTSRSGWARARRFFARTFPREVRRSWLPIAVCAVLTAVCAVVAYAAVSTEPANAYALLPPTAIPNVRQSLHDSNFGFDRAYAPLASTEIITNNIRVAAVAFAGGMTAGILTLWIIVQNGLMLGGLGALFARAGFGLDFWATIAPHGVLELSAIAVAGGAGLLLGVAIVAPGRARRVDAIVGKRAARGHAGAGDSRHAGRCRLHRGLRFAAAPKSAGPDRSRRANRHRAVRLPYVRRPGGQRRS